MTFNTSVRVCVWACVWSYAHCCACILFYVLSSFHFRLFPALKVIEMPGHGPVFVCVCACAPYCNSLILNTVYLFLQSLSSLFPVFSIYQPFTELKTPRRRYERIFYYSLRTPATLFLPVFYLLSFQWASAPVIVEWLCVNMPVKDNSQANDIF